MDNSDRDPWRPPGYPDEKQSSFETGGAIEERSGITGEDIEFALQAAEGLLAEVELARRQESLTRLGASIACAFMVASSALTGALLFDHHSNIGFIVLVSAATAVFLAMLPAIWYWVQLTRRRSRSSYLRLGIAKDIAEMLGQVVTSVAEREKWSYVRLEATKLRLSVFPLGKE